MSVFFSTLQPYRRRFPFSTRTCGGGGGPMMREIGVPTRSLRAGAVARRGTLAALDRVDLAMRPFEHFAIVLCRFNFFVVYPPHSRAAARRLVYLLLVAMLLSCQRFKGIQNESMER
jgi:hypothetical protein